MHSQPSKTRDYYMTKAREACTYSRSGEAEVFGVTMFYKPVAYYVQQARRANRHHVQNLMYSRGR